MAERFENIVRAATGNPYRLREDDFRALEAIGLNAYKWNFEMRATFLPCDFRVVFSPGTVFDPETMSRDSEQSGDTLLLPIGLGLYAFTLSPRQKKWRERADMLMEADYFFED
jgi:hypothetical protein